MKTILKILVLLVALVVILAFVGFLAVDKLAKTAVEQGGELALGVKTSLSSADIGLFSGDATLSGLEVANPDGFESPSFLSLGEAKLDVDLASLRGEVVTVPLFSLDGVHLNLERTGQGANYQAIIDHLKGLSSGGDDTPDDGGEAGPGMRFVIEKIRISNVSADVSLLPLAGDLTKLHLAVPDFELDNIGTESQGTSVPELFERLVQTLLEEVIEAGGDDLPAELLADLKGGLQGLEESLGRQVQEQTDKLKESIDGKLGDLLKDR